MSSKSDSQKRCFARFWFLHQVYSVIEVEFISKPKDKIENSRCSIKILFETIVYFWKYKLINHPKTKETSIFRGVKEELK